MIVYNLTDVPPPGRPKQAPQDLRILGKVVKPGGHVELPDDAQLARVSGWLYSSKISVDEIPSWYKVGRKARTEAVRIVRQEETEVE